MMAFDHIRFAGILVAAIIAAASILAYKRGRWRRFDLLLALIVAAGVAVFSVFPKVGDVLLYVFQLQNRGFAILVAAVLVLFALVVYLIGKVQDVSRRNGQVVTALAVRQYKERYDPPQPLPEGARGRILIVVPAYNEAGGIAQVLSRVPEELMGYEVRTVVVDDGSSDATEQIARNLGYPVVSHVVNRGQGDALRTGFAIAGLERADMVINLDADGQYLPEEMERLIVPIIEDEADFVLGSRFMGFYEEAGSVRHIGVVFFSKMISLLTGKKITDSTNGFRAIRGSMLPKLDLREDRFNATELILEALKKGLRFKEVPVTMLKRAEGVSKKPPKLRYPLGVFRVIIQTWLR
ncbi:glycosyltransferase family 2 protein [Rubrobacter calidifluminis]|uniref:glycosyltransferase family 2 protein n=1 Tax=Rubrobacter calidifluminis TaxID=1392640 RepID=UPI0023603353|nr:DUF2304 family protein [Rubrobacter calidifluminis]